MLEKMQMLKAVIVANKAEIVKKASIVIGLTLGLIVAGAVANKIGENAEAEDDYEDAYEEEAETVEVPAAE